MTPLHAQIPRKQTFNFGRNIFLAITVMKLGYGAYKKYAYISGPECKSVLYGQIEIVLWNYHGLNFKK